ncbi:MAG TPA: DUF1552 domain-containing protein [Polyangia bacterium]|nr:DUF1552 domain-containing protein [Polyangia bacterium]
MLRSRISRRAILRGVAGGVGIGVALPPLEAMFNGNGNAYADGTAIPRRLGIFFWGNGVKPDRWVPINTGAGWTSSPSLQPLEDAGVKDYVNVVSGTNITSGDERGHHSGTVGILSGAPLVSQPAGGAPYRSTFSQPSIDQVAAGIIGTSSRYKSLEVGVSTRVNGNEGTTLHYLSHSGPDSPNPPEYDPSKLFDRIFGAGFTPPGSTTTPVVDATLGYRKSVLDVVLRDFNGVRARAGAADKARLDKHADGIRSIESRLMTSSMPVASAASCKLPIKPSAFADQAGKEQLAEKTKAMGDLLAIALACNMTRVFSMMFTGSTASTVFWEVNITSAHHQLTHDEPGMQPQVQASTVFMMKCFASLLTSLKSVPEGAGNVLDNTAILASTDTSDGRFHSVRDYPILVAGKGGGYFKYPGIHYRSASGTESTSTVLLSVLRAAGTNLATVGAAGGLSTVSCSGIEA